MASIVRGHKGGLHNIMHEWHKQCCIIDEYPAVLYSYWLDSECSRVITCFLNICYFLILYAKPVFYGWLWNEYWTPNNISIVKMKITITLHTRLIKVYDQWWRMLRGKRIYFFRQSHNINNATNLDNLAFPNIHKPPGSVI